MRFQNIVENINEIIIVTGFDGKRLYTSPNFLKVFDRPLNDKYILFDKIHPEDRENLVELHKNAIQNQGVLLPEPLEFRVMNRYGKYIWFESLTKNYIDENGDVIGFVTSIREITEKKKAEKQLKESELKFRTITEQTLMGICIIQNFEIKYVNQQMADIYGFTIEEADNWTLKDFFNILHPDSRDMALAQLKKKQRGETDVSIHYIAKTTL